MLILCLMAVAATTQPAMTQPATTRPATSRPSSEAIARLREINSVEMPALRRALAHVGNPKNTSPFRLEHTQQELSVDNPAKRAASRQIILDHIASLRDEMVSIRDGTWSPPLPPPPETPEDARIVKARENRELWTGMKLAEANAVLQSTPTEVGADGPVKIYRWILVVDPNADFLVITARFSGGQLLSYYRDTMPKPRNRPVLAVPLPR